MFLNATDSGSALYVYCITAQSTSAPDGNSDMLFFWTENQQVPTST